MPRTAGSLPARKYCTRCARGSPGQGPCEASGQASTTRPTSRRPFSSSNSCGRCRTSQYSAIRRRPGTSPRSACSSRRTRSASRAARSTPSQIVWSLAAAGTSVRPTMSRPVRIASGVRGRSPAARSTPRRATAGPKPRRTKSGSPKARFRTGSASAAVLPGSAGHVSRYAPPRKPQVASSPGESRVASRAGSAQRPDFAVTSAGETRRSPVYVRNASSSAWYAHPGRAARPERASPRAAESSSESSCADSIQARRVAGSRFASATLPIASWIAASTSGRYARSPVASYRAVSSSDGRRTSTEYRFANASPSARRARSPRCSASASTPAAENASARRSRGSIKGLPRPHARFRPSLQLL